VGGQWGKELGLDLFLYFMKRAMPSMVGTFDVKVSLRHSGKKIAQTILANVDLQLKSNLSLERAKGE